MLVAFPDYAPEVFERLHARDFIDRTHRLIFETLAKQYASTGIVDAPQAGRQLKGRADADFAPTAYLLELGQPENVATAIHVPMEAAKIIDASRKRQLLEIAESAREAAINGQCAKDVLTGLDADLWEFRRNSYGEPRYKVIDAHQLATGSYALQYLIDGILVEGQPGFLGGPKKSLKTSLAMDLALSLVMGGCFLGKFRVKHQRRVAFLSGESGLASLQETALRVCRAMGIELAKVEGFTLTTTLPRLQDESDLTDCERFLADVGAEVVIADPLYLMLTGDDAGNLFKQGALLRSWAEMCASIEANGTTSAIIATGLPRPRRMCSFLIHDRADALPFNKRYLVDWYQPGSGHGADHARTVGCMVSRTNGAKLSGGPKKGSCLTRTRSKCVEKTRSTRRSWR